jgi:hypothetical protein
MTKAVFLMFFFFSALVGRKRVLFLVIIFNVLLLVRWYRVVGVCWLFPSDDRLKVQLVVLHVHQVFWLFLSLSWLFHFLSWLLYVC